MDNKTNDFFIDGKLSVILDGGAGSSGKGKIGAYMVKNSNNVNFVCNTFFPQASHTVVERGVNGKEEEYIYKQLNSCAHFHDSFEKMYIGHGSVIDVDALLKEIKMVGLPSHKLGISPVATILQDIDTEFEEGKMDLDGNVVDENHGGTIKFGSTCSGVGAARARRVLRRPNIKLARDIEELKPYICDVSMEIMDRLDKGLSGLLEIAQGFQLSYGLAQFYPYTTSRNCTIAAGFDDMMLPPHYLGNVCINFRTYPIRIHSKKYISTPPTTGIDGKEQENIGKISIPAGNASRPEIQEQINKAKKQLENSDTFPAFIFIGGNRTTNHLPKVLEKSFNDLYQRLNVGGGLDFVMEGSDFNNWYDSTEVQNMVNSIEKAENEEILGKTEKVGMTEHTVSYEKNGDKHYIQIPLGLVKEFTAFSRNTIGLAPNAMLSEEQMMGWYNMVMGKNMETVEAKAVEAKYEFVPRHLTWDEVQEGKIPHDVIESYSGDWYADQRELTWDELTQVSGSPSMILECTTLTKLPRRVATFSQLNLFESIRYNQTPHEVWISVNFANYVDWNMNGVTDNISEKLQEWCNKMIIPSIKNYDNVSLKFLGTSKFTDDTIMLDNKLHTDNILSVQ